MAEPPECRLRSCHVWPRRLPAKPLGFLHRRFEPLRFPTKLEVDRSARVFDGDRGSRRLARQVNRQARAVEPPMDVVRAGARKPDLECSAATQRDARVAAAADRIAREIEVLGELRGGDEAVGGQWDVRGQP